MYINKQYADLWSVVKWFNVYSIPRRFDSIGGEGFF